MTAQMVMEIPAQRTVTYPILIGSNLLDDPEQWLPQDWQRQQIIIITDDTVGKIYGGKLAKFKLPILSFPAGESSKSHAIKQNLEEKMIHHQCDRATIILALGGGVVGDIAGFIAATYMRGISYIQIPTTLLAMVDSSVGGKTGINTASGKNLIGAFWHPMAVVADIQCLLTLPDAHIINGLIEATKMFLTNDRIQFEYINYHIKNILDKNIEILKYIVEKSIKIKMHIVMHDEKEKHQRMILNFGHTIGHALEKLSNYTLLHGYAVALGILVEAKISQLLGILAVEEYKIIRLFFLKLDISGKQLKKFDVDHIIQTTHMDKKIMRYHVRYVLLRSIGQVSHKDNIFAHTVKDEIVKRALIEVSEEAYDG